jgi:hypothetical protein
VVSGADLASRAIWLAVSIFVVANVIGWTIVIRSDLDRRAVADACWESCLPAGYDVKRGQCYCDGCWTAPVQGEESTR